MKKDVTIKQYNNGLLKEVADVVVEEREVRFIIDNREEITVSMSPDDFRAFAYGFLLTAGLIEKPGDIQAVEIGHHHIAVQLNVPGGDFRLKLNSGCGSSGTFEVERDKKIMESVLLPDFETLPLLYKEFIHYSDIFEETGGIHSAAITDGLKLLFFSEDIGRHNAVDKVIGKALLADTDLNRCFLLTSGRISGEIVKKVLYARLRAIVSRSAPTCTALIQARRAKIGLIGFLRGKRFNIY